MRLVLGLFTLANFAYAGTAAFDLSGPGMDVKVTRAGKTLPISRVPNLQPGDRLWLYPDLPASQSVHYLLVAAFLRGSTNPPPDEWFKKAETWTRQVSEEGIVITVPPDAQQTLLFLAPDTNGGFSTLRSAVRGKPGSFVRASQDLVQASLDRSRLDKYLSEIQRTSDNDPAELHDRSILLARSLNIKLDQQCFDKPTEQQVPCLTQDTDQLVLNDGHTESMVTALTSGDASALIGQISYTKLAGGGMYSPYFAAVVDMARIMSKFHTASYQYIPALALPNQEHLNLKLNNPPSFHNPKSVLVAGLPAVESEQMPPLRPVNPNEVFCLQKPSLVLPVEGAPLVFSTGFAHDFALHVQGESGQSIDLPATPDAGRGGFVVDTHAMQAGNLGAEIKGRLRGFWGFEPFDGPTFHLRSAHPAKWTVAPSDSGALVVGRKDALHLQSNDAACVDQVTVKDPQGKEFKSSWKLLNPDELELQVPLEDATAGTVMVLVKQFGVSEPDQLPLRTYSEAAQMQRFLISAGDQQGILEGTRLDQVSGIDLNGIHFSPDALTRVADKDELRLSTANAAAIDALHPNDKLLARVALNDGRILELKTTVSTPRPRVALISKSIQMKTSTPSSIRLGNQDDLPQEGQISFFLKSQSPAKFERTEKIEVATSDRSFDVFLSQADGNLVLQDAQTMMATLDPLKSFGPSAFGQLRFRPVDARGLKGNWQPLANLVRIPTLKEVRCPDTPDKQCTLSGTNLFLIDSVASDPQFTRSVPVPVGFVESTLRVPRPNGTLLYMKLRDDPTVVNTVALPVLPEEP